MRWLVVALIGCSSHASAPPQAAIDRCAQGAQAMLEQVSFTRPDDKLACADLYREPACAAAWNAAFHDPVADGAAGIADACTHAYCPQLSEPPALCRQPLAGPTDPTRVAQLRELDAAILIHDGLAPDVARAIAGRAVLFTTVVAHAAKAGPPPPTETLVIAIDEAAQLSIAGTPLDRAALPGFLTKLAIANGRLVVHAQRGTAHGKVVELMEAAKQAGVTHLAIESD